MPVHLDAAIHRSDILLVADRQQLPQAGHLGAFNVTFRAATRTEQIIRNVRNFFTFGMHSRLSGNPTEWRILKENVMRDAAQAGIHDQKALARLFLGYSDSEDLTAAKMNNILADFERLKVGQDWIPQFDPSFVNADHTAASRAIRTIHQRFRSLTPNEQQLKESARVKKDNYKQVEDQFNTALGIDQDGDPPTASNSTTDDETFDNVSNSNAALVHRPPLLQELASGQAAADAIMHILRPGRRLGSNDVDIYLSALKRQLGAVNQQIKNENPGSPSAYQFGYKGCNHHSQNMSDIFRDALVEINQFKAEINETQTQQSREAMFAIPLVLHTAYRGDHIVLAMVDFKRQQINLLDSKGYSIEKLEKEYLNTPGLKNELEQLGHTLFGQQWDAKKNILQMVIPKQKGANDCGAFVCDFTRQLISGNSVGDIERTFDPKRRSELRLNAAETIHANYLENLDTDLYNVQFEVDNGKELVQVLANHEPEYLALQKPDPVEQSSTQANQTGETTQAEINTPENDGTVITANPEVTPEVVPQVTPEVAPDASAAANPQPISTTEPEKPHSVTPPTSATITPSSASAEAVSKTPLRNKPPELRKYENRTDSPEENPRLYDREAPFATGGIVNGYYVERQYEGYCFAHASAAYFGKNIFPTTEDYFKRRNDIYNANYPAATKSDEGYGDTLLAQEAETQMAIPLLNQLSKEQSQPNTTPVPWVGAILHTPRRRKVPPNPEQAQEDKEKISKDIDAAVERILKISASNRFIVRTGGKSGHYQTLVFNPEEDIEKRWTIINSSSLGGRLPQVISGRTPTDVLGERTREETIGIFTQSHYENAKENNTELSFTKSAFTDLYGDSLTDWLAQEHEWVEPPQEYFPIEK